MSDRPVFIYAATYADPAGAEADYDALLELHAADLVGTYDVALVTKDAEGKVHLKKHEKPTQHGAWGGVAVGAAVGILAAPAVIPAALVGGVIGGIGGHLKKGISRGDAKELGDMIEAGQATLLVIGESRVEEQLDKALTRAEKSVEKEIDVDAQGVQEGTRRGGEGTRPAIARRLRLRPSDDRSRQSRFEATTREVERGSRARPIADAVRAWGSWRSWRRRRR